MSGQHAYSMSYSKTTALVCFHPYFRNRDAAQHLSNTRGFRRVKHIYELTNWAMVEVAPGYLDLFLDDAERLDEVEHCEYNRLVVPATIDKHIGNGSDVVEWNCEKARTLHRITRDPTAGIGVKIALLDTGLAPHPYLPALSFDQCLSFSDQWPDSLKAVSTNELSRLAQLEAGALSPLRHGASGSEQATFLSAADQALRSLNLELRKQWDGDANAWLNTNLPGARRFRLTGQTATTSPIPRPPLDERTICGPLRRIDPRSKNFIDDDLCVFDNEGHGTQMAGVIAGRPGLTFAEGDPVRITRLSMYEVDTLSLVPYAELLVLKCWDSEADDNSNVGNLVRAMEYALAESADLVYCGLSVSLFFGPSSSNLHFNTLTLLQATIDELAKRNLPVIAPIGNDGNLGLSAPAAFTKAFSIAAAWEDLGQVTLAPYCNKPLQQEAITFAAYGGQELSSGLLTTDLYFGFNLAAGTSVAAAIASGLVGRFLSKTHSKNRFDKYENEMLQSLGTGQLPYFKQLFPLHARYPIPSLISEASKTALAVQGVVNGVLREF